MIRAAGDNLVSSFVHFDVSNTSGVTCEFLNDGARIEVALNHGEVSILLADEEAVFVLWGGCD